MKHVVRKGERLTLSEEFVNRVNFYFNLTKPSETLMLYFVVVMYVILHKPIF